LEGFKIGSFESAPFSPVIPAFSIVIPAKAGIQKAIGRGNMPCHPKPLHL
jgi:hypothetical protein